MTTAYKIFTTSALVAALALSGCGPAQAPVFAEPVISDEAALALVIDSDAVEHERNQPSYRGDRYNLEAVIYRLRYVCAPLFSHYGLRFGEDWSESQGFRTMIAAVSFTVSGGTVTVTNKATGGVIFVGHINRVSSGTFTPENIPGGAPVSCTYTYTDWAACQPDGTQARTVASALPAGCSGTPVLSQACTYTPPAPVACTYTAGAWGACQPDGTQTRTVTASPVGCTPGTPPASSQSCTYIPPVVTCTGFTYTNWSACDASGQQTRTVLVATPTGCTGGSPVLSQSCTPTCTSFTYNAWTPAICPSSGKQTRTVATSSPPGCTGGSPVLTQSCTYVPPVCTSFTYSAWSTCSASGTQTRTVVSSSPAGCTGGSPVLSQSCTPPPPACGTCHAIPPNTGQHVYHVVSQAISCSTCHGTGYSSTTTNPATHMNGTVDLTAAGTACNVCHGSRSW